MNTEKTVKRAVWMGPVMAVVMVMVLMVGLEVTVWADEDDDEKAEMRDFVAAVYRGQGQYNMAGSIATGEGGVTRDFSRKGRKAPTRVGAQTRPAEE